VESLIGQQLGDYIMEAELGRGSMGVVYRARHTRDGKTYAVKCLLDALTSDMSFITRFTREARIIAGLHHPNIIQVYDAGRHRQYLYFVMEYFPGQTAGQMLKERQRLPVGLVTEIAAQAADALNYAHSQLRVVHRDIKPENLLVDRWCRVKVLDFGLARVEGLESITRAGTVVGSLYYVSPEQLLGQQLDGRSDIYALGVSMYEMLTGMRPYRGQTLTDMSRAILSGVATPPSTLEPSITPELERIIRRALARDLAQRYSTGAELHADLRAIQAALPPAVVPAPNPPAASGGPRPQPQPQQFSPAERPRPARSSRMTLRPASLEPASPDQSLPRRTLPPSDREG
jgi:eukaryotic-like serine/threonine-protein kinase